AAYFAISSCRGCVLMFDSVLVPSLQNCAVFFAHSIRVFTFEKNGVSEARSAPKTGGTLVFLASRCRRNKNNESHPPRTNHAGSGKSLKTGFRSEPKNCVSPIRHSRP